MYELNKQLGKRWFEEVWNEGRIGAVGRTAIARGRRVWTGGARQGNSWPGGTQAICAQSARCLSRFAYCGRRYGRRGGQSGHTVPRNRHPSRQRARISCNPPPYQHNWHDYHPGCRWHAAPRLEQLGPTGDDATIRDGSRFRTHGPVSGETGLNPWTELDSFAPAALDWCRG